MFQKNLDCKIIKLNKENAYKKEGPTFWTEKRPIFGTLLEKIHETLRKKSPNTFYRS